MRPPTAAGMPGDSLVHARRGPGGRQSLAYHLTLDKPLIIEVAAFVGQQAQSTPVTGEAAF